MKKRNAVFMILSFLFVAGGAGAAEEPKTPVPAKAFDKEFTVAAIEYEGSKIWVPGTLIVKKGDKVKVNLINNLKSEPNTHGYAIDAFGIKEVIARGEPKAVTFTAGKSGVFTIYCHQHPKHIGGQILVLE